MKARAGAHDTVNIVIPNPNGVCMGMSKNIALGGVKQAKKTFPKTITLESSWVTTGGCQWEDWSLDHLCLLIGNYESQAPTGRKGPVFLDDYISKYDCQVLLRLTFLG